MRVTISGTVEVGRECAGVILTDAKVSRHHLSLSERDGDVVLTDMGSSNGTFVDGTRVVDPLVLTPGTRVTLGSTELELLAPVPPDPQAATPPPAAAPVRAPLRPVRRARRIRHHGRRGGRHPVPTRHPRRVGGEERGELVPSGSPAARGPRLRAVGRGSQICLVDPFPDPADPATIVTERHHRRRADAARSGWSSPRSRRPSRSSARCAAVRGGLPAADELGPCSRATGCTSATAPDPDAQLRDDRPAAARHRRGRARRGHGAVVRALPGRPGRRRRVPAAAGHARQPGRARRSAAGRLRRRARRARGGVAAEAAEPARPTGEDRPVPAPGASATCGRTAARGRDVRLHAASASAFTMVFPFALRRPARHGDPERRVLPGRQRCSRSLGVAFVVSLLAGLRRSVPLRVRQRLGRAPAPQRDVRASCSACSRAGSTRHQQGDVLSRMFSDVAVLEAGPLADAARGAVPDPVARRVVRSCCSRLDLLLGARSCCSARRWSPSSTGSWPRARRSAASPCRSSTGALIGVAAENYGAQPVVQGLRPRGPRERAVPAAVRPAVRSAGPAPAVRRPVRAVGQHDRHRCCASSCSASARGSSSTATSPSAGSSRS